MYGLEQFPESHALSRENASFPYEIRDLLFGLGPRPGYRAAFTIHGDVVHILTVQRGTQNIIRPDDIPFNGNVL